MEKETARLKDWYVDDKYAYGKAYGHWRFKDGTDVTTSYIENIKKNEDEWIIETRNTIYICRLEDAV